MESTAVRVARGAKLLDEKKPNWFRVVDRNSLNQDLGAFCVLGQNYGDYCIGMRELRLDDNGTDYFGFSGGSDNETQCWLDEIEKRLNNPSPDVTLSGKLTIKGVEISLPAGTSFEFVSALVRENS